MLVFPMARVLGVVMTAPVFGNRGMPMRIRLMVGLGITLANLSLFVFQKFIEGSTQAGIPYWVVGSFKSFGLGQVAKPMLKP